MNTTTRRDEMRVLSVHQPYAWLIAEGYKDVENRSQKNKYRGAVAIQAGLKFDADEIDAVLYGLIDLGLITSEQRPTIEQLRGQCGCVIAVVEMVGCSPSDDTPSNWATPDGYCYELEGVEAIEPVKVKGRLGLYRPTADEREQIEQALEEKRAGKPSEQPAGLYELDGTPTSGPHETDQPDPTAKTFDLGWSDLVGSSVREETNTEVKEAKREAASGRRVKTATARDIEAATFETYLHSPHGSLPMDQKWGVKVVREDGHVIYRSPSFGDDGIFEKEPLAEIHGQKWKEAQRKRRIVASDAKDARLQQLPKRMDEIDRAHEALESLKKQIIKRMKECNDDHKTLRDEQRTPEAVIVLEDGAFKVADAPSLSDGTIGRRWWGCT